MQSNVQPLKKNIVAALERGSVVEAIKLLRESGVGIKDALATVADYSGRAGKTRNKASDDTGSSPDQSGQKDRAAFVRQPALEQRIGKKLAPGEVPQSTFSNGAVLVVGLAVVAYYLLR